MGVLDAFLSLSDADARSQWQQIAARDERARQERYLPVEVILCFALFFVIDPHRYGGKNIDQLPGEVHQLARLLRRTAGSLTSKMLNLDGSRPNAARAEPELFAFLGANLDAFFKLYVRVLAAARDVVGAAALPDLLREEVRAGQMLGQDELTGADIDDAIGRNAGDVGVLLDRFALGEGPTTRLIETRVRLGQQRFARCVLSTFERRCAFCGFGDHGLEGHRLLVASHIKPWRSSADDERLDPGNGVAACPVHDTAFDTGLLAVDANRRILRARSLTDAVAKEPATRLFFDSPPLLEHLRVPSEDAAREGYLAYHRAEIFEDRVRAA